MQTRPRPRLVDKAETSPPPATLDWDLRTCFSRNTDAVDLNSLRYTMDNSASSTPEPDGTSRRRSGRVVKAPTKFAPDAATKRKRGEQDDDDDDVDEDDVPEMDDDESDDVDADSDDDHPAPKSRSRKPAQASRARKPSSKKPKTNGTQPSTLGHTTAIPTRPKKSVRIDTGGKGSGLFGRLRCSRSGVSLLTTCS